MKWFGIAMIALALGIGIVPQFTDCFSQGHLVSLANGSTQPMKCHWTGIAEIGVAAPLVVVGGMMTAFRRRKQNYMMLGVLGIVLAGVAISLPTFLIGTCGMPTHVCNTAMKPSLLTLGSLAAVASLGVMLSARKAKD